MQRILNIIGWIGTALVVAAVGLRIFGPPDYQRWAIYLAWTGLAFVLLYPIGQWREIASQFNRRQARYATLAATSVLVVLGILVAVNYLSTRRNARWDLTANQVHTLSEQSQKVLSGLDAPLQMILVDRVDRFENYRDRLAQYSNASNRVSIEYLDGDQDPVRARQYEVQAFPTLILQYKDKTEKVTSIEEREITSAVIRAVSGEARKAYFVQGHGERDIAGGGRGAYSGVAQLLKDGDNVAVETLLLSQQKEVPADASVVVIAGPTADFLEEEVAQLQAYLEKGGKLLLMLDAPLGERPQPLTRLTGLARAWGVEVGNDIVLDVSGRSPRAEMLVAQPPYPAQAITQDFRLGTLFPVARSVTPVSPAPPGRTIEPIVQTSAEAWAETDIAGLQAGKGEPELNAENGDKPGPVTIAVAVSTPAPPETPDDAAADTKTPPQTRIAVFGDADFASDDVAGTLGNVDLFLNTINWLTAQEDLIAIRPRERSNSRLTITPGEMDVLWWVSVVGIPAAVFGIGIVTWMRRRSV